MRAIVYFSCAILVALPNLYGISVFMLSLLQVQFKTPFFSLPSLLFSFGSLVPSLFFAFFPGSMAMVFAYVMTVLGYAMMLLVLRRFWLLVAKKQKTPASFMGFQKALGYVGFWSFLLSVLAFPLAYTVGLPISPIHLMMLPMLCVPWAFFITEIASFWQKASSDAAV